MGNMRCIFCKADSSFSKSVEHIVPESLGNKEHTLPPGVVCDKCNNYISRAIEKRLLEQPYFSSLRFRNVIRSKKGKYPREKGVLRSPVCPIEIARDKNGSMSLIVEDSNAIQEIITKREGVFYTPAIDMPENNDPILSRFIGKVGMEYLAMLLLNTEGGLEEVVEKNELDRIRGYVRYGEPGFVWPYSIRRIYSEDEVFSSRDRDYQILHEFRLLYTDLGELYVVLAIMGLEYCLNMGEPDLHGYVEWLRKNNNRSPLESDLCGSINVSTLDDS